MGAHSALFDADNRTADSSSSPEEAAGLRTQSVLSPIFSQSIMSTVPDSLSQLVAMGLLTEDDLSICGEMARPEDASMKSLIELLVERRRLTKYQGDLIVNGRPDKLVMGEYIVLERLGKGGMGEVYKAYHRRMHREVAIKVLLESGVQSQDKIERFRREAIAAARMNHPNIVTAYDANEHEGIPYLVMEYVKGRDLASLVKKGDKLAVPEAVNYMLQTARGMEYAHSRHIIHRDLKPSNLLLAAPDDSDIRPGMYSRVKILDMGLARLTQQDGELVSPALEGSDLSATGILMGTVDYMAPEQAMDTKRADHRSDIYSLGCTLYYLLTKKPVYTGANLLERISAHYSAPIPSLKDARPDVPEELDEVFKKMVAKKPRDRYQSMTEVALALQKIDRQLSGPNADDYAWPEDLTGSGEYQPPGSSYGGSKTGSKSGSGTQGSAPTIASGSGPFAPAMPGSSFGSTAYDEGFTGTGTGTITVTGMPLMQKLIMVVLLGLMSGALVAIVVKMKNPKIIPPTPIAESPPLPPYLPTFCVTLKDSKIKEIKDQGHVSRYYDVIAVDLRKLLNGNKLPPRPAVAEKPEGPAIAEKFSAAEPLVRFRLIDPGAGSNLRPFYMMETKVSNDLFRVFAQTHPELLDPKSQWTELADGRLPVFNVSVKEADRFARWMGGELPSTKEWDTAAGYYLDEEDQQSEGPYIKTKGKPNVAVHGSAVPVDAPTDDISPLGIRHMAGNGREFTRTMMDGPSEIEEGTEFHRLGDGVYLRGWSYIPYRKPLPLSYDDMREMSKNDSLFAWGGDYRPTEDTSFRVVLEIPKVSKSKNANPSKEKK